MTGIKIKSIIFFIALSFLTVANAQQIKKPLTADAELRMDIPSNPIISPDGNNVLFTIRKGDLNTSEWVSQVYLLNVKTKNYFQFSQNAASCTDPQYSPDGKWITFLSSRKFLNQDDSSFQIKVVQLWAAPVAGGEGLNWTYLPNDVEEYAWSDNSRKIALLSEYYNEGVELKKEELEKRKLTVTVYPHKNPDKVLYIFDVKSKKIISSFTLDPGAENISFNSKGDKIIYQTNYTGTDNDAQKFDIYTISLKGRKTQLTSAPGPETNPHYSPDGDNIAFITQTLPDVEFAETDLNIMGSNGRNKENLTKDFNLSVDDFTWRDNQTIFFTVKEGTNTQLYEIRINTGKIKKLSKGNSVISGISFSADGKSLCYLFQNSKSLPEIYVNNLKVSNFSKQLENFKYGTQEVLKYKSKDKKFEIEGILFKPENFDPHKKYPLILIVHGGPYGRFQNKFLQYYAVREFNNAGYLVFAPNPRGSSGYSDQFSQAARYDLGGNDYRDIMAGVNYIISKGYVDTAKMGVTGGSYGGYLTDWIISQSQRFKAAVSMYGIFNLITDWSNSNQPAFEIMWLGYHYWDKPINMDNLYISRSPAFYTQQIITPTLILHGEDDVSTGLANSMEMYQALHAKGVPVKLVVYPRAGHGLENEPNQYLDTIHRSVRWFTKYLK